MPRKDILEMALGEHSIQNNRKIITSAFEKWIELSVLTLNMREILPECRMEDARRRKKNSACYIKLL